MAIPVAGAVLLGLRVSAQYMRERGKISSRQLSYITRELNRIAGIRRKVLAQTILQKLCEKYFTDDDLAVANIVTSKAMPIEVNFERNPIFRAFVDAQKEQGFSIESDDFYNISSIISNNDINISYLIEVHDYIDFKDFAVSVDFTFEIDIDSDTLGDMFEAVIGFFAELF